MEMMTRKQSCFYDQFTFYREHLLFQKPALTENHFTLEPVISVLTVRAFCFVPIPLRYISTYSEFLR